MTILVSLLAGAVIASSSRRLMAGLFNPLSLFAGVWSLLISTYSLGLLPYYTIQKSTWIALALSGCMFCLGCLMAVPFVKPNSGRPVRLEWVDLRKLRITTYVLYLVGLALFIQYASEIQNRYTLAHFLNEPWRLRIDIMQRDIGWSLRYFYFTIPAAVLAFLYLRVANDAGLRMKFILITSLVFGVATTGRTAVIWLLAWLACVHIYLPAPHKSLKKLRIVMLTSLVLVVAFGFFVIAGNWVGKTYENSGLATVNQGPERFSTLVIPYFYFTSNVPAFQNLLTEEPAYANGKYSFLPLFKVLATFTDVSVPSELSEFTQTPFPGNTYTYLWPYYMDFGYGGILIGPLLLGFAINYVYLRMKRRRMTLAMLFSNSLLATAVILSFGTNRMISAPTWWFLLLAPVVGRICRATPPYPERSQEQAAVWGGARLWANRPAID